MRFPGSPQLRGCHHLVGRRGDHQRPGCADRGPAGPAGGGHRRHGADAEVPGRPAKARGPASVHTCALLAKPSYRASPAGALLDFVGFDAPDAFVVGYGMDAAQLYRNLPYVGAKPRRRPRVMRWAIGLALLVSCAENKSQAPPPVAPRTPTAAASCSALSAPRNPTCYRREHPPATLGRSSKRFSDPDDGNLSKEEVDIVVLRHFLEIVCCYDAELRAQPDLAGSVVIGWQSRCVAMSRGRGSSRRTRCPPSRRSRASARGYATGCFPVAKRRQRSGATLFVFRSGNSTTTDPTQPDPR